MNRTALTGQLVSTLASLGVGLPAITSAEAPANNPVPGGIAVLALTPAAQEQPRARFGGREVLVMQQGERWHAVVGLPCDMLPGNYIVSLTGVDFESMNVELGVIPHAPPVHVGTNQEDSPKPASTRAVPDDIPQESLFNPSMTEPPQVETGLQSNATPAFDFRAPVESRTFVEYGRMPSDAGLRCHDYLSYFLAPGSQVYTPAPGLVSRVDATRENGIRVVLDHGSGTLSVLGNLRAVLVETGQQVDQGEILGTVGAAGGSDIGRLDWAVSLNGYRVDPLQFSASP